MTKFTENRLEVAKRLAKEKAEKLAEDAEKTRYAKHRTEERILIHNESIKAMKDPDYQSDTTFVSGTGNREVIIKNIWSGIEGEKYIAGGGLNPFDPSTLNLYVQTELAKSNPKLMRYLKGLVTPKTWAEQIKEIKGKK